MRPKAINIILLFSMIFGLHSLLNGADSKPVASRYPADEDAINKIVAGFDEGWNRHDAKTMCEGLADNVEWVSWRGEVTQSRKQVEDQHSTLFANLYKNSHRADSVKAIHFLSPELASVDDFWTMTGAKKRDGSDWPYRAGYVNFLMVKRNGRWIIIESHTADFDAKAPSAAAH